MFMILTLIVLVAALNIISGLLTPSEGQVLFDDRVMNELPPDGTIVRVYLENQFWGMAERQGDLIVWRAVIAPEN